MKIYNKSQIVNLLPTTDKLLSIIKNAFILYSKKQCVIPPVGYLPLTNGEIHIKYGMENNTNRIN